MNNPQPQIHPEYSRVKKMFEEIKHCDDNDLPCPYSVIHNSEFAGQNLLNAYCNYYSGSSFEELFGDGKIDNPRYANSRSNIIK